MTRNDLLNYLGISLNLERQKEIISKEKLRYFYAEHKDDKFTDSEWKEVQIRDIFKNNKYYKKNYKRINNEYNLNLPNNLMRSYEMKRNEIKSYLWIN